MGILRTARRKVGALIGGFSSGFEAAGLGRRLATFMPSTAHINTLLASAGPTVLARARYIARNNGYARNAVDAWTANVVGAGITPQFQFANKALKRRASELFAQWTDEADAEGLTDFYGIQRRVAREMFLAGEVFVRMRPRRTSDGLSVPLQLQVIPSEMCPLSKTELFRENGHAIRQGIEFDAIGQRVAYHFYKSHPGDYTDRAAALETVRVPAGEVIHLIDPEEAGQIRGVTRLAAAIVKLFLLDIYDDAELDRKKVAALHALFVTTPEREDWDADGPDEGGARPEPPPLDVKPGATVFLQPGEDVTTSSPAESGNSYEPFQYRTLLQVSAATGIPYAVLTNDLRQASYGSQRAGMVEFRRRLEAFQHSVMVFQFCRAVAMRFMDVAQLSGALPLPGYEKRRREYATHPWLPPRFEWIDPWKDAQAEIAQINAGLKSRSMAIAERGYDAEMVDEQIATDREREKRLGLQFGDPAQRASMGHNGGPPLDDADEREQRGSQNDRNTDQ